MHYPNMQRLGLVLGLCLSVLGAPAALAQDDVQTMEQLLEQIRSGQLGDQAEQRQQLDAFNNASREEQRELLAEAQARREALQATSAELEKTARANQATFEDKTRKLKGELGENAALFGILQQNAQTLIGSFRNSPTSLQYPDRVEWLEDFVGRMQKASEIFSTEEIRHLWYLMQQETAASGKIVHLQAEVLGESGGREQRPVVRVGKFNLVTDQPEPLYLAWQPANQRASVLKRQPAGGYLDQVADYLEAEQGVHALGIDPTGGALLTRLVDAPSLGDRIDQGGLIGYLILALGAVGVLIALYKLAEIVLISGKVERQRRHLDTPDADNPLGRMLNIYERNRDVDTETLEMRLGEAILEEKPKVDRFVGLLKVIAAVAPLMGLMGTVIGMIATFQAITLFGTGDPKTMAGGISQALVTTVLGLTVAIPMVLLHAVVAARAKTVINTLKHQTAGLIAERMEDRGDTRKTGQAPA